MADNQHGFGRMNEVFREEYKSDDFNRAGKIGSRNLQRLVRALLSDGSRGVTDGILDGFVVSPGGGLSVNVGAGLGFRLDALNPAVPSAVESDLRVIGSETVRNLVVTANVSGNPRIDIVQVRDAAEDAETTSVNTITGAGIVVPSLEVKREEPVADPASGDLVVKAGTPAASPVPPSVDAGFVKVAEILVANGAAVINASDITDTRRMPLVSPRLSGAPFAAGRMVRTGAGTAQGDFTLYEGVNVNTAATTKRDALGIYRVTFRRAPPDVLYGVVASAFANVSSFLAVHTTKSATLFAVNTVDFAGALIEMPQNAGFDFQVFLTNPRA